MAIIRCKLDVTKIDKSALFQGEQGKYLDITLLENKDGEDKYGNNFMVVQDIGKDRRESGQKGPILGNGKYVGQRPVTQAAPPSVPDSNESEEDDIPF